MLIQGDIDQALWLPLVSVLVLKISSPEWQGTILRCTWTVRGAVFRRIS